MTEEKPLSSSELKQLREIEKKRLMEDFETAPFDPDRPKGVLLSDEIDYYCRNFKLVHPYNPDNLMAASYELRVGDKYSIGNRTRPLSSGMVLQIPKFEVVVIEILETINMPPFLIGRWNIRTRWAYQGLIWVGGPQVNPGYRGRIMCPIWNLSSSEIKIAWGESIAVMDFETTTPSTEQSNGRPKWNDRTRYVFEEYMMDLRSGLVTEVETRIAHLESKSKSDREGMAAQIDLSRNRVDNFISIMFTVIGVLVAALAIFATTFQGSGGARYSAFSLFVLSSATTILALLAWLKASGEGSLKWSRGSKRLVGSLAIVVTIVCLWLAELHHQRMEGMEVRVKALETEKDVLSHKVNELQKQQSAGPKR